MAGLAVVDPGFAHCQESPYRRALKASASALLCEVGFTSADNDALETIIEMLQSVIVELARSTKNLSELAGRTDPVVGDVVVAMVEMGLHVERLPAYARRPNRIGLPQLSSSTPASESRRLQVGLKLPHPPHISEFMPDFPDPHTYIKSHTFKPPVSEYQVVREKASAQKRDVERALTRFIAKTGDTENLFPDDPYAFPLIANKPKPLPYLDALLPKDYELDSDQDEEEKRFKQQHDRRDKTHNAPKPSETPTVSASAEQFSSTFQPKQEQTSADATESETKIDNPYLRPIVMPKLKSGSKKYR